MDFQLAVFFLAMLSSVAIGVYVIAGNRRSFMHLSFGTLVISLAVWSVAVVSLYLTESFAWSAVVFMSGAVWFAALLFFSYSFPHGGKPSRAFYTLAIPAAIIFLLAPFNVFVTGLIVDPSGNVEPVNNLPFLVPFLAACIGYVGYSFALVARNYRRYRAYRMQFRYFFIGIGTLVSAIVVFDSVLPALGVYRLNLLGPAAAVVFVAFTSYAVIRHELLDVRIVIQRGLVYTILLAIVIACYVIGLGMSAYFLHVVTEESALISAGITTTVGVFFLKPLENYFRKKTDHIFFKDKYDYADALHTLSRVLYTSLNLEDILAQSEDNLKRIFKTASVEFVLKPGATAMLEEASRPAGFSTLSQPIMFEDTTVGFLRLGPKLSGDAYTKDDKKLVSTFAFHAAVAIAKAELHEQVREYSLHLEQLVDERTVEVKRMQEDQREIMIDISHNLQTPLAIIRGELEMLGETSASPSTIDSVRNSIDRVSGFIRQLLHLARLEHSIYAVERVPLSISALVREQVEYFEVMAAEKSVRLETSIEGGCRILGNRRLLGEVFVNLVTNAITYRDKERPSVIRIGLRKEDGKVIATVEDNGIGIPEKDLPEIFLRFYRVPNTARDLQGTGLGLAIVKNIVEKHEGAIAVESALGAGTVFTLSFPAAGK